jgi:hypothetical protein
MAGVLVPFEKSSSWIRRCPSVYGFLHSPDCGPGSSYPASSSIGNPCSSPRRPRHSHRPQSIGNSSSVYHSYHTNSTCSPRVLFPASEMLCTGSRYRLFPTPHYDGTLGQSTPMKSMYAHAPDFSLASRGVPRYMTGSVGWFGARREGRRREKREERLAQE